MAARKTLVLVAGAVILVVAVGVLGYLVMIRTLRAGLKASLVPPTTEGPHIAGIATMTAGEATARLGRLGVSIDQQSLLRYVKDGNGDFVRMLLLAGVSPDATDSFAGQSALQHAADHPRKVATLRALLTAGANVNAQDKGGSTPLLTAALVRNALAVRALLDGGADPWVRKNTGETAIDYADSDEIRALLREAMKRTQGS